MVAWLIPALGAVASAGASLFGAKKQADAAKDASSAQIAADREALQIQQENLARKYALLAPIANNQRRFVGLSQAAAGGTGYMPQALPKNFNAIGQDPGAAAQDAALDSYIQQNPWLQGYWNSWEAGGAAKGKYTHRQQFGDFRGYAQSEYAKVAPRSNAAPPVQQSYTTYPDGFEKVMKDGARARWNARASRFERLG